MIASGTRVGIRVVGRAEIAFLRALEQRHDPLEPEPEAAVLHDEHDAGDREQSKRPQLLGPGQLGAAPVRRERQRDVAGRHRRQGERRVPPPEVRLRQVQDEERKNEYSVIVGRRRGRDGRPEDEHQVAGDRQPDDRVAGRAGPMETPADEADDRHVAGDGDEQPRTAVAQHAGLLQDERDAARGERQPDADAPLPEEDFGVRVRRRTQIVIGVGKHEAGEDVSYSVSTSPRSLW